MTSEPAVTYRQERKDKSTGVLHIPIVRCARCNLRMPENLLSDHFVGKHPREAGRLQWELWEIDRKIASFESVTGPVTTRGGFLTTVTACPKGVY